MAQYEIRMQKMINISEHETILNTELQKSNQSAQERLDQIKTELDQQMEKSISEQVKACEDECAKQLNEI